MLLAGKVGGISAINCLLVFIVIVFGVTMAFSLIGVCVVVFYVALQLEASAFSVIFFFLLFVCALYINLWQRGWNVADSRLIIIGSHLVEKPPIEVEKIANSATKLQASAVFFCFCYFFILALKASLSNFVDLWWEKLQICGMQQVVGMLLDSTKTY